MGKGRGGGVFNSFEECIRLHVLSIQNATNASLTIVKLQVDLAKLKHKKNLTSYGVTNTSAHVQHYEGALKAVLHWLIEVANVHQRSKVLALFREKLFLKTPLLLVPPLSIHTAMVQELSEWLLASFDRAFLAAMGNNHKSNFGNL